jgi:hypothetical protein
VVEEDRDTFRLDELWAQYATPRWDLRVGNQIHTWGSMETLQVIDVLNPRDYESHILTPDKIGQPTVRARWLSGNSSLTGYYLPYFIPPAYPGQESPYSVGGTVFRRDDADPELENQFAVRYFYGGSGLDVGLSAFSGLERESRFEADLATGLVTSRSYRSKRAGVDVTKVLGALLLKTELVYRDADTPLVDDSFIWSVGTEYTWPSVLGHSDLTAYVEVAGGDQNVQADDLQLSQHNAFIGATWELKDRWRQAVEVGWVKNYAKGSGYWTLLAEYSVRPIERLKVSLEYLELADFSMRERVGNSRSVSLTLGFEF